MQSVLRWPDPEQLLQQVQAWAGKQRRAHPSLQWVGLFGSNLDLLLVDSKAHGSRRMAVERNAELRWLD